MPSLQEGSNCYGESRRWPRRGSARRRAAATANLRSPAAANLRSPAAANLRSPAAANLRTSAAANLRTSAAANLRTSAAVHPATTRAASAAAVRAAHHENVTLEGAIGVAQLTNLGVKYILVPLSRLTATIEGDALQVLINAVQTARANLAHFNITVQWMDNMQTLLTAWHDNISLLPKSLNAYATADIDGALTYLTALKALLNAERSAATPTPTPKA